jgi:DNA-directed RNA polymerase beta' subunit
MSYDEESLICSSSDYQFEIDNIVFSLFTKKDIKFLSVCEVNSSDSQGENSVYDERMGGVIMDEKCITCGIVNKDCPGHFGHINLSVPIIHPLYNKSILIFLKIFCFYCSRLIIPRSHLSLYDLSKCRRTDKIEDMCKKLKWCINCDSEQPKFTYIAANRAFMYTFIENKKPIKVVLEPIKIKSIFDQIRDDELLLIGINPKYSHPKNFILELLPVLPPRSRSHVVSRGIHYDDELTHKYLEIVKVNNKIASKNIVDAAKHIINLELHIQTLMISKSLKTKNPTIKNIKSLKERITGKKGRIRENLMGKRSDFNARTVAGPDTTLKIDEIAIPESFASVFTIPIKVVDFNISYLQSLVDSDRVNFIIKPDKSRINLKYFLKGKKYTLNQGDKVIRKDKVIDPFKSFKFELQTGDKIQNQYGVTTSVTIKKSQKYQIKIGDIVERQLQNNDVVIMNRQPTLHRGSMLAFKVQIRPHLTIRTNLGITTTFNLDYDGDELNIHVPQNIQARTELEELACIHNNLMSCQDGKPIPVLIQDTILGINILTQNHLNRENAFQCLMRITNLDISRFYEYYDECKDSISGCDILSLIIPPTFYFSDNLIQISKGRITKGIFTKGVASKLIKSIFLVFSKKECMDFLNDIQYLANDYLLYYGFSVGYQDCLLIDQDKGTNMIGNVIDKAFTESEEYENMLKTRSDIAEIKISNSLNKAKDIGKKIAKELMRKDNKFKAMIEAGSKGNFSNICQISGLLGQQNVNGKRIKKTISDGQRTLSCYPFVINDVKIKYESRGFISSSFLSGLNPQEFFFHATSSREGITDTACKTSISGYIQRKMIKVLEDVSICYDRTVRNVKGTILQFAYGNDCFDGSYLNPKLEFCNCVQIAEELNALYERNALN